MREREMFYLTTHSTHFIYGYMASDIWLRTILIVRKETRCRHIGYSYRLAARVLLYAPSHRQDSTYYGFCYTSRGSLAGTRYSLIVHHEGSIRRPIAPRANALTAELHLAPPHNKGSTTANHCRKEGNVLFNDGLNTFYFTVIWRRSARSEFTWKIKIHTVIKYRVKSCTI